MIECLYGMRHVAWSSVHTAKGRSTSCKLDPGTAQAPKYTITVFFGRKGPQTPGCDVTPGGPPSPSGSSQPIFSVPPLAAGSSRRRVHGSSQVGAQELPHILSHPREHPASRDSPSWPKPFGPIIQTGAFGPFVIIPVIISNFRLQLPAEALRLKSFHHGPFTMPLIPWANAGNHGVNYPSGVYAAGGGTKVFEYTRQGGVDAKRNIKLHQVWQRQEIVDGIWNWSTSSTMDASRKINLRKCGKTRRPGHANLTCRISTEVNSLQNPTARGYTTAKRLDGSPENSPTRRITNVFK
ncbi:hypothetical protein C8J57DRAFT_1229489 [Mycena rebaudengoi]|nr:hypothetical protein C8J57DRAFT_1229489 [Mycena rebaudengoi]